MLSNKIVKEKIYLFNYHQENICIKKIGNIPKNNQILFHKIFGSHIHQNIMIKENKTCPYIFIVTSGNFRM